MPGGRARPAVASVTTITAKPVLIRACMCDPVHRLDDMPPRTTDETPVLSRAPNPAKVGALRGARPRT